MHSGESSDFKIECDELTHESLGTLAYIISKNFKFSEVYGIPNGGTKLAKRLKQFIDVEANQVLIVDDVLTTGNSMREAFRMFPFDNVVGVVLFARDICPNNVYSIFNMELL